MTRHCIECGEKLQANAKFCICGIRATATELPSDNNNNTNIPGVPKIVKAPQRCHVCHQIRKNHTCSGACTLMDKCGQAYLHRSGIKQQGLKRKLDSAVEIQLQLEVDARQEEQKRKRISEWIKSFVDFLLANDTEEVNVPWRTDALYLLHAYNIAHRAVTRVVAIEKGFVANKRIRLTEEQTAKPSVYSYSRSTTSTAIAQSPIVVTEDEPAIAESGEVDLPSDLEETPMDSSCDTTKQ